MFFIPNFEASNKSLVVVMGLHRRHIIAYIKAVQKDTGECFGVIKKGSIKLKGKFSNVW